MKYTASLIAFSLLIIGFLILKAAPINIVLEDGSEYQVEFLGTDQQRWVYRVSEIKGKDLSHFVLGLCGIQISEPTGGIVGFDPALEMQGVKWNTPSEFVSEVLTITTDNLYSTDLISVGVKAGIYTGYGSIEGPNCSLVLTPTSTLEPSVTSTAEPTQVPTITLTQVSNTNTPTATTKPTETPTSTLTPTPTNTQILVPTPTGTLKPTGEKEEDEPIKRIWLPFLQTT